MQVHVLERLASPEIRALAQHQEAPRLAILPLGACEQHGPHLPLGTDSLIVEEVLQAARARLQAASDPGHVLILPLQRVGLSSEHMSFPGTLSLNAGLALDAWFQILRPLAAWGVDRVLLINGHGGQAALTEVLGQRLRSELGLTAMWCHIDALGEPEGLIPSDERRIGLHGGLIETALMLAICPELVNMALAETFESARETATQGNLALRSGGRARHAWQAEDLNPAGVVGNARAADASLGRKLLDHRAKALAQIVKEALTFQLNPLPKRENF